MRRFLFLEIKKVLRNKFKKSNLTYAVFVRHLVAKLRHRFPIQGVVLVHGGRVGFFQGDIRLLMDDLQTLKPTVFPMVPRLLNRMCDKVSPRRSGAFVWIFGLVRGCPES